ncbi:MAG: hypothetical protein NWR72_16255 [Bacteroidia bacterium]|nr:hypothetical protein [Bacteroidia bacterium]
MRYLIFTLLIFSLVPTFAQRKLTIGVDLFTAIELTGFGISYILYEDTGAPLSIGIPYESSRLLIRLRPSLRLGCIFNTNTEGFVSLSTYGDRVTARVNGSSQVFNVSNQTIGGGIRFYAKKRGGFAPFGSFWELSAHSHMGKTKNADGELASSQHLMEYRWDVGKQFPVGGKALMTIGIGLGVTTALSRFSAEQPAYEELQSPTEQAYKATNLIFLRIGVAILP